MEIKQILPGKICLKIERIADPLYLNLLTIEDNIWLDESYPDGGLDDLLRKVNYRELIKVILRMLDLPSKKILAGIPIIDLDEYGAEVEVKMGLLSRLYHFLSEGEISNIIGAIVDSKMKSNEIVQKFNEKYEKKRAETLNGKSSLTSSPVSTDLPLDK